MNDPAFLTITEARSALRAGALSALELVDAVLSRAERLEPQLNCLITQRADEARAEARAVDDQPSTFIERPLAGIPLVLKDNIATAGVRSTGGSKILADHVPTEDAPAWGRLRAAGAILLGKANLHEFGMGATNLNAWCGHVHNPWDIGRVPGGSSGGTAAALAAGLALGGLGTDAGGSVRIPSALCGIVGLKQTHGLVPVRGGIGFSNPSVDHIGPMARSVADVALLLTYMAGLDPRDPTCVSAPAGDYVGGAEAGARDPDLRGLRVGVPADFYFSTIDPGVEHAVRDAIAHLAALGAEVVEAPLPDHDILMPVTLALHAEGVATHQEWMRTRLQDYTEGSQVNLLANQFLLASEYAKALRARRLLKERYDDTMQRVDVIAAPTVPAVAPTIAEALSGVVPIGSGCADAGILSHNTRPSNLTGLPAISLPCGFVRALPVGLMLIGHAFAEEDLLRVAAAYEATTEWHTLHPQLAWP